MSGTLNIAKSFHKFACLKTAAAGQYVQTELHNSEPWFKGPTHFIHPPTTLRLPHATMRLIPTTHHPKCLTDFILDKMTACAINA
jgi:hypothetical protein